MFEQGQSNLFLLSILENKVGYPGFSYHKKFPNFDSLASLTDSSNLHVVSSTLFRVFRIVLVCDQVEGLQCHACSFP